MSYRPSEREVAAILTLDGPKRYEHFLKRVADWEEICGLKTSEVWTIVEDEAGRRCIPFWPHHRYAEAYAAGDGSTPKTILLADFLAKWLPEMERDGLRVAIFPAPAETGVVVEPSRLKEDLEAECEQYE